MTAFGDWRTWAHECARLSHVETIPDQTERPTLYLVPEPSLAADGAPRHRVALLHRRSRRNAAS
jgi:hypothetical protein